MATRQIESVEYFAMLDPMFVREWPSGLLRRTVLVGIGVPVDDAWASDRTWTPTLEFIARRFGSSDVPSPRVQIDEPEAETIRGELWERPRGGPFSDAGQAWLAAHPEDRAAKYLGVTPPVYDRVGRLVTPMGPVAREV